MFPDMQYRPAIDGLRAVAVALVLLYHAKAASFPGGYVGVDVFFVISGYLITSLILHDQSAGRFSLARFYERRARRILPAFFLVAASTLVLGTLFLLPPDLVRLGSSTVAATLFLSNVYFWRVQGHNYLLDENTSEPLLHTWSLAIEEQFYLVFPLVTLAARRFVPLRLGTVFVTLAVISLAISIYLTHQHPWAAFYFPLSRAWELLLGASMAVIPVSRYLPNRCGGVLQGTGLALIVSAAVFYDTLTPFPGLAALVPCLGSALIVGWSHEESMVQRALRHPIAVGVGLISYSLYLWHWPLLLLSRHLWLREPNGYEIAAVYGLAVMLAAATWQYVEQPFRHRQTVFSARQVAVFASVAACVVVAFGWTLQAREGARLTPPPNVASLLAVADDYAPKLGR